MHEHVVTIARLEVNSVSTMRKLQKNQLLMNQFRYEISYC
jgi:hypothetical protein